MDEKLYEALDIINHYFDILGIPSPDRDYEHRPNNLPENVSNAWDVLEASQDEHEAAYSLFENDEESTWTQQN